MATDIAQSGLNGNGTQGAIAPRPQREVRVVHDDSPVGFLMDTAKFEHLYRVANVMALGTLLPDHLKYVGSKDHRKELSLEERKANCFRICMQAMRWGFDPFAIVDETYVVGGKLGYQGKLVAAVVHTRANLTGRLSYSFSGKGDDLTVTVSGTFQGETEPRTVALSLKDGRTDNQMWRKDPQQKLIYSGVVKWARRHCPEVIMGVVTDDDLDRMQASSRITVEARVKESSAGSATDALADAMAGQTAQCEPQDSQPQPDADEPLEPADVLEIISETPEEPQSAEEPPREAKTTRPAAKHQKTLSAPPAAATAQPLPMVDPREWAKYGSVKTDNPQRYCNRIKIAVGKAQSGEHLAILNDALNDACQLGDVTSDLADPVYAAIDAAHVDLEMKAAQSAS